MKRRILLIALTLLVITGSVVSAGAAGQPVQQGEMAYDFTVDLMDGTVFTLSDHLGKVVIVNVWATWCGPCVREIPDLQKMAQEHPDTLIILGLNSGEDEQTVRSFVTKNGMTYPQALDVRQELIRSVFPSRGIPYSIVIDPAGKVTQTLLGSRSYDEFALCYQEAMAN